MGIFKPSVQQIELSKGNENAGQIEAQVVESLIECFTSDDDLDELLVHGPGSMHLLYRDGTSRQLNSPFQNEISMIRWLQDFAHAQHLRLDPLNAQAGGDLYHGAYRWHALIPPLCSTGPILCLRKSRLEQLCLQDFHLATPFLDQIAAAAQTNLPIIICGPSNCGKTSLLFCLLKEFCSHERVIIVDSGREIIPRHPRWISLHAVSADLEGGGAYSVLDLEKDCLRLSPDRIVLAEVRAAEARFFLHCLSNGHGAPLCTIHSKEPDQVLTRLHLLASLHGMESRSIAQALTGQRIMLIQMVRAKVPEVSAITLLDLSAADKKNSSHLTR